MHTRRSACRLAVRLRCEAKDHHLPAAAIEFEYEMPGFVCNAMHQSGRVERLDDTDTVPPSPSGDPARQQRRLQGRRPPHGIHLRPPLPPRCTSIHFRIFDVHSKPRMHFYRNRYLPESS
jgi:hypothetical protein